MSTDRSRPPSGSDSTSEPDDSPGLDAGRIFEAERRQLIGVAYRLLGTMTDAEDVLHDVFERWLRADRSDVDNPGAYLTTMTTRAAIDRLRSARARRELYVGPWLPEPIPTEPNDRSPEAMAELDESLTIGYLHLLEQLTPRERAAHLLHDVYDFSYREISAMIDRDEPACRQLASRARSKLRAQRPDRDRVPTPEVGAELCHRLTEALIVGDIDHVMALMADDVIHISDGGADHKAARRPVVGVERVARLLVNLAGRLQSIDPSTLETRQLVVNHWPAVLVIVAGRPLVLMAVDVVATPGGEHIAGTYAVVNPDKLGGVLAAIGAR